MTDAPSDTQMRSILDPIEPGSSRPAFRALHSALQRGNALKDYAWGEDTYLAANGPHLQSLQQHQMDSLIGAKPGGNRNTPVASFNWPGRIANRICTYGSDSGRCL